MTKKEGLKVDINNDLKVLKGVTFGEPKHSTTSCAKQLEVNAKALLLLLTELEYIRRDAGNKICLTERGEQLGGEYRIYNENESRYVVWDLSKLSEVVKKYPIKVMSDKERLANALKEKAALEERLKEVLFFFEIDENEESVVAWRRGVGDVEIAFKDVNFLPYREQSAYLTSM